MAQHPIYGSKITRQQAHDMIEAYKARAHKPGKEKLMSVLISKSVLQEIIAPVDCEYVRFYMSIHPAALGRADYHESSKIETAFVDTDHTLVISATDANGNFLPGTGGKSDGPGNGDFYDNAWPNPPFSDSNPPV